MMLAKKYEAEVSVNGWMIRPALGPRGLWWQVDGTAQKFDTQADAEAYASTLTPRTTGDEATSPAGWRMP